MGNKMVRDEGIRRSAEVYERRAKEMDEALERENQWRRDVYRVTVLIGLADALLDESRAADNLRLDELYLGDFAV